MIELTDILGHLRLPADDTSQDAVLLRLRDAALANLEHETGRAIRAATRVARFDGFGAALRLPWLPVRSVDQVRYRDAGGVWQELDTWFLDDRGWPVVVLPAASGAFPQTDAHPASVEVTAQVGYDELPPDLAWAALLLIGHGYEHREAVGAGESFSTVPMGVRYLLNGFRLPRLS